MAAPSRGWSALAGAVARAWQRVFSRPITRARRLQALGKVEEACALLVAAGWTEEASQLYALRAEDAAEPGARVMHLTRAAELASGPRRSELRRRRARVLLELVTTSRFQLTRVEIGELGQELEALAEPALAAQAFALAGDVEGETRALVAAGAVETLEQVLDEHRRRDRENELSDRLIATLQDLDVTGRRREAFALASAAAEANEGLRPFMRELAAKRVRGPLVSITIEGLAREAVFGAEVILGRVDAALSIPSPAVSRAHVALRRRGADIEVADLGSRNGTFLAGARLDAPVLLPPSGELELWLGSEVRVTLSRLGTQGVAIGVAGRSVAAPLGPLRITGAVLDVIDGWLELQSDVADLVLGGLRVGSTLQLCRGDVLRRGRDGPILLEVPK